MRAPGAQAKCPVRFDLRRGKWSSNERIRAGPDILVETMSMNVVQNDFRRERCPFCDAALSRVGQLQTPRETEFSTHRITLAFAPELAHCPQCTSAFTQNAIPEQVAFRLYSEGQGSHRWTSTGFERSR